MIDNVSRGILVLVIVMVAWFIKPSHASIMIIDINNIEKEKE
jgi:hypothetical protein|tara:strand:- start:109 stop:234 length:126 start_codon:yes stop_codon:yes gene_type:complete